MTESHGSSIKTNTIKPIHSLMFIIMLIFILNIADMAYKYFVVFTKKTTLFYFLIKNFST